MSLFTNQQLTVVGIVGGVALWYVSRKAGDVAEKAIDSVNPLSQDNAAYRSVNAVGEHLTGNENFNLGAYVYDGVDTISGWFGNSDADKHAEVERRARAQYEALAYHNKTGGF